MRSVIYVEIRRSVNALTLVFGLKLHYACPNFANETTPVSFSVGERESFSPFDFAGFSWEDMLLNELAAGGVTGQRAVLVGVRARARA